MRYQPGPTGRTARPRSSTSSYRLRKTSLSSGCWKAQATAATAPARAPLSVRVVTGPLLKGANCNGQGGSGYAKCHGLRSAAPAGPGEGRQSTGAADRQDDPDAVLPDLPPHEADGPRAHSRKR